jgi:hypothetical protein
LSIEKAEGRIADLKARSQEIGDRRQEKSKRGETRV